jgi:hypothetical protein
VKDIAGPRGSIKAEEKIRVVLDGLQGEHVELRRLADTD